MLTSSFRKKPQKFKRRRKNERKGVKTKPVTNYSIKAKTIFFLQEQIEKFGSSENYFLVFVEIIFQKLNWFTYQQLVICWLYFKVNL